MFEKIRLSATSMRNSLVIIFMFAFLTPLLGVEASFTENEKSNSQSDIVVTVDSTNFRFSPSEITIDEGQTVRFFWSGELLGHNAVEENELFDSGEPETNVDYLFEFEIGSNGTYTYVCEPHKEMGMVGTIIVNPIIVEEGDEEEVEEEVQNKNAVPGFLLYNVILMTIIATKVHKR